MVTFILLYLLFGFFVFWITYFMGAYNDLKIMYRNQSIGLIKILKTGIRGLRCFKLIPFVAILFLESFLWPLRLCVIYTTWGKDTHDEFMDEYGDNLNEFVCKHYDIDDIFED